MASLLEEPLEGTSADAASDPIHFEEEYAGAEEYSISGWAIWTNT